MKRLVTAVTAVLALATVSACGSSSDNPLDSSGGKSSPGTITIGSANFLENVLLADMYAGALKKAGFKVDTKLNIGSREIIYDQAEKGTLDVLPEYNGALLSYLDPKSTAGTGQAVNAELKSKLASSLEVLDSSEAQDRDTVVVTKATAAKYNLKTLADLKAVAPKLDFGAAPEDRTRQQGLVGLGKVYGIKFKSFTSLDQAGPLTIAAIEKGNVQAGLLYTTTPQIASKGFVALEDPENVFGVQNVTPLVYKKAVDAKAQAVLNKVSAAIDTTTLTALNKKVQIDKEDADKVAQAWLKEKGLG